MDFPSYLGSMPMHAITEMHGEPGLLERFRLEIQGFDEPARERLSAALDLAAELHRDDRRVREPYLNHLLRVAIRMMHHYQVRDVDVIVAGLLHDAVEDHPAELAGTDEGGGDPTGAALAALADRFGPRVARLVARGHQPGVRPGTRPARAVPGAPGGEPGTGTLGPGDQGFRLHRQRGRRDPHRRAEGGLARRPSTARWCRSTAT